LTLPSGDAANEDPAELFKRIKHSNEFVNKCYSPEGFVELEGRIGDDLVERTGDPELAKLTAEIVAGKEVEAEAKKEEVPVIERKTLSQALRKHKNLDSAMSDLWKLLYYLRCGSDGEDGCDKDIVPNPLATRSIAQSKPQTWQNRVQHQIKLLDEITKQPAIRQSRQAAWMTHTEEQRQRHAPTLPPMLEVDMGHAVAFRHKQKWELGWITSVWRTFAAKSGGGQLVARPLARGNLHAARVVCAWFCVKDGFTIFFHWFSLIVFVLHTSAVHFFND
jgi:hypothetical protein